MYPEDVTPASCAGNGDFGRRSRKHALRHGPMVDAAKQQQLITTASREGWQSSRWNRLPPTGVAPPPGRGLPRLVPPLGPGNEYLPPVGRIDLSPCLGLNVAAKSGGRVAYSLVG